MTLHFPQGFVWGTATAAYQVEGAADEAGRSPSIWDAYLQQNGHRGDNGDVAADHYHLWRSDLDLLSELGAGAYRFSASWSRVMPDGRTVNREGLDFYRHLVDGLLERGISPALTMYHMDLPHHFQAAGGWSSRETALRFADYAEVLVGAFGDSVPMWMTVNELYYESWMGYCEGSFPPGWRDSDRAVAALHHMLLAHGFGVEAVRSLAPNSQVGLVTGYAPVVAATDDPLDVEAARATHIHANSAVLDPVLRGSYPEEYATHPSRKTALEQVVHEGDLAKIGQSVDFIGLNYYFQRHVAAIERIDAPDLIAAVDAPSEWLRLRHLGDFGATEVRPKSDSRTMAGWAPDPDGIARMLLDVTEQYGPIPLYVTENGLPLPDYADPSGDINDIERIEFIRDHLTAVHRACAAGADVRGYFAWSLMDNLEWTSGFGYRFGLTFIDYATQRRTPKASFRWYSRVAAENGLDPTPTALP